MCLSYILKKPLRFQLTEPVRYVNFMEIILLSAVQKAEVTSPENDWCRIRTQEKNQKQEEDKADLLFFVVLTKFDLYLRFSNVEDIVNSGSRPIPFTKGAKMRERNYSTLSYLLRVHDQIRPQYAFHATDETGWKEWHKGLRTKLSELLGGFPEEKCPLDAEILGRTEEEDYVREKLVFESEPGVSVPAYLLLPKDLPKGRKSPALLCLHGHGRGKDDAAGIARDDLDRQRFIRPLNYDYAHQFACKGYITLAPDSRCFGERAQDDMSCSWAFTSGLLLGKIMVGMRVWDAMRAVDYLLSRPEVDPERIGCVGLSWGGTHTIYTSALDDRIKVAVVSGYFSSFKDTLIDRGECPCQYVPNILKYADLPDIVALIAPRPLLIENGTRDPLYTLEVVKEEYKKLERVYEVLGVPERVDIDIFEGGHQFSGRKAFDWFDRWL